MHEIILNNIKVNYKYSISCRAKRLLLKICLDEKTNTYFIKIVIPSLSLNNYNTNNFEKIINYLNIFVKWNSSQLDKSNINILDSKYSKIREDWLNFLRRKKNWALKNLTKLYLKKKINFNSDLEIDSREHFLNHKSKALILCENKVEYWSEKMWNLDYNNIKVKKLKTRWWSCSSKSNLNFNYKILFLKKKDQDYLIVHELSHLVHMNHSPDFWMLVCETLWDKKYYMYKIR